MDTEAVRHRLWDDLVRLRAPEGYLRAGAPRYATLFGRDSLIAAWETLSIDPRIAESTLRILAKFQGRRLQVRSEEQPGKILHEHRFDLDSQKELPDWDFPYFGSIDSTPLFLIVAHAYASHAGDERLVGDLWTNIEAAYRWMIEYGDKDGDGYLEYDRTNPRGLLHQGWKDGLDDHLRIAPPVAMVEVQGYAFAAHRAYAALARLRGDHTASGRAEAEAARLREALNRDFWMSDQQFFALALDRSKQPRKAITSNPGHLLFTGIVNEGKRAALVDRLFWDDLWTPFGIRTHATSEPDFDPLGYHTGTVWPHDNWLIYKGLRAAGFVAHAERIRSALFAAYKRLGRIPELYAVVDGDLVDLSREAGPRTRANPIQAWSSGALLEMLVSAGATP